MSSRASFLKVGNFRRIAISISSDLNASSIERLLASRASLDNFPTQVLDLEGDIEALPYLSKGDGTHSSSGDGATPSCNGVEQSVADLEAKDQVS